jgi:hypothetical protein
MLARCTIVIYNCSSLDCDIWLILIRSWMKKLWKHFKMGKDFFADDWNKSSRQNRCVPRAKKKLMAKFWIYRRSRITLGKIAVCRVFFLFIEHFLDALRPQQTFSFPAQLSANPGALSKHVFSGSDYYITQSYILLCMPFFNYDFDKWCTLSYNFF